VLGGFLASTISLIHLGNFLHSTAEEIRWGQSGFGLGARFNVAANVDVLLGAVTGN
jgi:hypothetical protein